MQSALEILATLASGLFAGAAIYINLVEHPARMRLDTAMAAAQWAPSYARATWMQAPLAVIGLLSATAAWWMGSGTVWLVAGLLLGSVVPFTLIVIMPTNAACSTRPATGDFPRLARCLNNGRGSTRYAACSGCGGIRALRVGRQMKTSGLGRDQPP